MSFNGKRKKQMKVKCRSRKQKRTDSVSALCRCRRIKYNNLLHALVKKWHCTDRFFSYCRTKSLSSCITECEASASHQGLALGEPTGKTMQTVIRILFSPILGINNLFVVHVYTNNKMFSCVVVTLYDTVAVLL